MTYLFDSNCFMEAARLYYSFELAPGFWEWLVSGPMRGHIASTPAVRDEIGSGSGDLVDWATRSVPYDFWRPVGPGTLQAAQKLSIWAADPARGFTQAALAEFLASCDYWLIAEAVASGLTVVSREKSAPGSRKSVKIPDVCRAFEVQCKQPFPVYQSLGLKLS
ncbi:MAG: DUF4411 family protein [Dermatophilaceae bacterium]